MSLQKNSFLNIEADNWFERNYKKINSENYNRSHLNQVLKYINDKDNLNILEIGCSSGNNLNFLKNNTALNHRWYGVEPSSMAISAGSKSFPFIRFIKGTADDLSVFDSGSLDLVVVGFCFYVIDRQLLLKVVSEVDRVLKSKGKLIIFDFDAKIPIVNKYIHHEGLSSYKMDYSELFLSSPNYFLISKESWSHKSFDFHEDLNERCSTWVLHKEF